MELIKSIEAELAIWEREIAAEKLAGNIVKENYCKGVSAGLRIALQMIPEALAKARWEGAKEELEKAFDYYVKYGVVGDYCRERLIELE